MPAATKKEIAAYRKHLNLKLAAEELGMCWQTLYTHLKASNEPIIGNKSLYGSDADKFAAKGEQLFKSLVPQAERIDQFQSKFDFIVNGYKVDIKSARPTFSANRWAFSIKKQERLADFFICFAFNSDVGLTSSEFKPVKTLLIPAEITRGMSIISLPLSLKGKWLDYEVDCIDLCDFFLKLKEQIK